MVRFWKMGGRMGILVVTAWLAGLGASLLDAQEAPAEKKPTQAPPASTTSQKPKRSYHRLPPYYGQVVTPEQRKQIYAIQDEYGPKIDALRQQLEQLLRERDQKIASLLTEQQRKEIERLRQEAKAKRTAKQNSAPSPKSTPAAEKPASPPAAQPARPAPLPSPESKPKA